MIVAVVQLLALIRVLGFPVGDGAAEKLLKTDRRLPLREMKKVNRMVHLHTSHSVSDKTHLARGCRNIIQLSYCCILFGFLELLSH